MFGDGTYYLMETLMRVGRTFYGLGSLLTDAKVHSFLSLSDYPYTYKYKIDSVHKNVLRLLLQIL